MGSMGGMDDMGKYLQKVLLSPPTVHEVQGHAGTYFDVDDGYGGLGLVEVACNSVHSLWYIIQYQIQIHFIFLQ